MFNGYIPKNITYISKPLVTYTNNWDEGDEFNKYEAKSTFVSDSDNAKTIQTGKNWATNYDNKKYTIKEFENNPINNVVVIGLEHRGEGGRAYKIIVNNEFLFDLREDVLLDTIINEGISKSGKLNGTFIWGCIGPQRKLIRVGSQLHNKLLNTTSIKNSKKITSFEIGGIYQNSNGSYIYLGKYSTTKFEYEWINRSECYWGSSSPQVLPQYVVTSHKELKNYHCFYRYFGDLEKAVKEIVDGHYWGFHFIKSPSFKVKKSYIDINGLDLINSVKNSIKVKNLSIESLCNYSEILNVGNIDEVFSHYL